MALRRTATAIVALALAAVFGSAAKGGPVSSAQRTPDAASAASSGSPNGSRAATPSPTRVTGAAYNEDADGARIVLSADAPLLYTAYEPRPDLLVVDLPGVGLSDQFQPLNAAGALVSSARIESVSEMGKQLTRLTIAHREGVRYDVRTVGQGLAVSFEVPRAAVAEPSPPSPPEPAREELEPAPTARAELAHALEEVRVIPTESSVTVALRGDGLFRPKDFVLENPPRVVIDLPGVRNAVRRRVVPVNGGLVSRVRISQFQFTPDLVTRVVLDLSRPLPHELRPDGETLSVLVSGTETGAAPLAEGAASRTTIAEAAAPAPQPVAGPAPVVASPVETKAAVSGAADSEAPARQTQATEALGVTASTEKPVERQPEAAPASPAPPAPAPAAAATSPQEPAGGSAPPAVSSASPPQANPPERSRSGSSRHATREEALFEAAAAILDQEQTAQPGGAGTFQPRTIAESQTQFTGEPVSLDLKDADIKDVFRTISQLTQLNIVVDPEVRGTVTVQLEDVPWDQALDLILKQNSLGYVLENNIMRIATTAKLQSEQADRARLAEARQAAEPTRTVIKKLSYARAGEITATVKSVMSKRGDIVVDARTNTLIIREIPTYLPAVLQLIENLDTATPQVMIESRIVETTKSLGRSLGINWGFSGVADVAHGNTTNLQFPNTIDFRNLTPGGQPGGFRVPLAAGTPIMGIRLANALDSFGLDLALSAAENQGLLKIISSPKVAALTNTAASIQSGVQIPVQTTVNNTTTVIYVDATLKLTVTPQITNEGTILLDVSVSKREPAVALNLSIGNNVPLTVREYKGQVLVRDGGTTVIGGIFQINDQDQNNMIPGLWKIPIFGNLFRNTTRTEKHDELLIFITPRILRS
ncbi:MAG: type IV pilus secretin PilQ [Thermoanaerobaculia bacterium]